jgi:hypothetical protein
MRLVFAALLSLLALATPVSAQTWIWGFTADVKGYVLYPDGLIRLRDVKYANGRM